MKFNLKQRRLDANLTQDKLSELSGVPQSTISFLENSGENPKTATLLSLALVFDCTVNDLIVSEAETA